MSADEQLPADRGLTEALRAAVERTLSAAGRGVEAGSAALDPERRAELLDELTRRGAAARDELSRRGQDAGAELSRRGQEAGAELTRRGQEARDELSRRIEVLEKRLASLEDVIRSESKAKPED